MNKSQYKNLGEWRKANPRDYQTACSKGYLVEICKYFGWKKPKKVFRKYPNGYWTPDRIFEDAKKYNTPQEWKVNNSTAHSYSFKTEGLYHKCIAHMDVKEIKPKSYWTPERILSEAVKYKTTREWKANSSTSYSLSFKTEGLYHKCQLAMGLPIRRRKGYWDVKENVLADARKYKTRSKWAKGPNGSGSAYSSAIKNGWFEEAIAHMEEIQTPSGYWLIKENVLSEAKKYKTSSDWLKNQSTSYHRARENGWFEEATAHMEEPKIKANGHWQIKENVLAEARKYKTRSEWSKNAPGSYNSAKDNGWHDECVAHMEQVIKPPNYWTKEKVLESAKECKTISEWAKKQSTALDVARKGGYYDECVAHMELNSMRPGYWNNKSRVLESAKKYKTRSEWQINEPAAKKSAKRNGWYAEATTHMVTLKENWTKEKVLESAKKYKTKHEWRKQSYGAYNSASKNKWLEEATAHMEIKYKPKGYWTKEKCIEDAKKYKTRSEWSKNSGGYSRAKALGCYEECVVHMEYLVRPNGTWTKELLIAEARKWNTITEWVNNGEGYSRAKALDCHEECVAHMTRNSKPTGYWNVKVNVLADALKYKTKSEWQKHSNGAKKAAKANGWYEEATAHMKKRK